MTRIREEEEVHMATDVSGFVKCDNFWIVFFLELTTKEIKRRIALARQKAVVLASIWKDQNIKTATKSIVWAVFQYGVERWTLQKADKQNRSF